MLRLSHAERPMSRRLRADDTGFNKKPTPEAGRFNTLFRGEASGTCKQFPGAVLSKMPLTPALSQREREVRRQPAGKTHAAAPSFKSRDAFSFSWGVG
jgi:hypothetical protein